MTDVREAADGCQSEDLQAKEMVVRNYIDSKFRSSSK
jgi:hypothetical protein